MSNNIAIIGGGIGGLVTALAFEKLNIPYTLYERAPSLEAIGAGIWLSPNALQVLEWIHPNLLKEVQQNGNSFDRILVADHLLRPISDAHQHFVQEKFGYTTTAIHRGKLQQLLYSFVDAKNIHLNKAFERFIQHENDRIILHFNDKTKVTTNALIGADGIHSKVRKQLFPKSNIRYSGQTCWRGVSEYTMDSELDPIGFTLWGKKLQFGVSKIADGKIYWFAVKLSKPNQQDNRAKLKTQLLDMFSDFNPLVQQLITHTPDEKIMRNDLSDLQPLSKWNHRNICLLGDAAHSMTPDLGQGGAQAIEDAFYLSHFIKNSTEIEKAFTSFCNYRKPKVDKLVKQSRLTSKIAITNRPLEVIRNVILRHTPEKYMQKQLLELYALDTSITNKKTP